MSDTYIPIPGHKPKFNLTQSITTTTTDTLPIVVDTSTASVTYHSSDTSSGFVGPLFLISLWFIGRHFFKKKKAKEALRQKEIEDQINHVKKIENYILNREYFSQDTIDMVRSSCKGFAFTKGEDPLFSCMATYYQDKIKKEFAGRSAGVSVRIAKGVTARVGGSRGVPVENRITERISRGQLVLTNKNLYFKSDIKSLRIPYAKLATYEGDGNELVIQRDAITALPQYFVTNRYGKVMKFILDAVITGEYAESVEANSSCDEEKDEGMFIYMEGN